MYVLMNVYAAENESSILIDDQATRQRGFAAVVPPSRPRHAKHGYEDLPPQSEWEPTYYW